MRAFLAVASSLFAVGGPSDTAPLWSPSGSVISFVRTAVNGDRQIWMARPDGTGNRASLRSWGGRGRDWSRDGARLAYDECCKGSLLQGYAPSFGSPDDLGVAGLDPHYSPESVGSVEAGRIAYVTLADEVAVVPVHADFRRIPRVLAPGVAPYSGLSWSADGTRIVFARAGDIFAAAADGSGIVDVTRGRVAAARSAAASTTGDEIAFLGGRQVAALYIADRAGRLRRVQVAPPGAFGRPVWSADGTRVAVRRGRDVLVLGSRAGTEVARIRQAASPTWSPKGARIAFVRACRRRSAIFVRDLHTGRDRRLTNRCRAS